MSGAMLGRRSALRHATNVVRAPLAAAQAGGTESRRTPPRDELVNVFEFEDVAKAMLPAAAYSNIAGSDRSPFDRMTFRPRMCVPTLDLDVSVTLFGQQHFMPLIVGPVAGQRQYHAEGEVATVRGAGGAKAAVVISNRASVPIRAAAAAAKSPLWFAVYADDKPAAEQVQEAVAAGCSAVCISIAPAGSTRSASQPTRADWSNVDELRKGLKVPVLIKGVTTAEDARSAVARGISGVVVSTHGASAAPGSSPIEIVSSVADAVGGQAAVLVDGGFRRGSDILKALILGADAVLIARPVMWGLAAYGADGVQTIIAMLQSDLGRQMGAIGASNQKTLTRSMVKLHRR